MLFLALAMPAGVSAAAARPGKATRGRAVVRVVAAENFWGSIASQLGGTHVNVVSIITNPNTDPHSYEPTAADARTLADAQLVIENGIGYDPWTSKLLAANGGNPAVLNVGDLLGVADGGNPHRWYNPADVRTVIGALVADLQRLDRADATSFTARETAYETVALQSYDSAIAAIHARYAGVPVGASESIFAMMAPALGLNLITPPTFLKAVSEGADVSAADKETIEQQITAHEIRIYVYNGQNVTPDVQAQLRAVKAAHIPSATITETLVPAQTTFQHWQTRELLGIEGALARARATP